MKLELCQQIFGKSSYIKFHENLPSGSRAIPCGHTHAHTRTDRKTDMAKLTVAFRTFTKAPNKENAAFCAHGVFTSFLRFFPPFRLSLIRLFDEIFSLYVLYTNFNLQSFRYMMEKFICHISVICMILALTGFSSTILVRLVPRKDPSYRSYGLIISMVSHESKFIDWAIKTT